MKKIKIISVALVLGGLIISSCGEQQPAESKAVTHEEHGANSIELTDVQYKNAGIELGTISEKSLSNVIRVSGVIDAPPKNLISISAPFGGYVVDTDLLEGMYVKKGQKLVTLEHQDYIQLQEDYLNKKSQLNYMKKDFDRQESLHKENVNSDKVFQRSQADFESLEAQVNALVEKLAYIGINASNLTAGKISRKVSIVAPENGFVSKVNINRGKYCNPTDVLFEIVNTDHLHAELTVYEKDLSKLKIGQAVQLKVPSLPNRELKAEVYLIGKMIGNERFVRVHAHFEKDNSELLPGMYVNATIATTNNMVNSLPEDAVLHFEGKDYIVLFEGTAMDGKMKINHFELLEVTKGIEEGGNIEVVLPTGVIAEELKIVIKGAYSVLAKLKNSEEEGHGH